jgi:hypothetical protein
MVMLSDAKPLTPSELETIRHQDKQMPGRNAYTEKCFAEFRKMFEELGAERPDLLLLDATRVFASETEVTFADPAHLTQLGRELLTRAIGQRLVGGLERVAEFRNGSIDGGARYPIPRGSLDGKL